MAPATIHDVKRTVAILKHHLVDGLRAVLKSVDEGFAKVVLERTMRTARARHTNAAHLPVVLDIVCAEEQIIPTTFRHDRRRPQRASRPPNVRRIEHARMLDPCHEIPRREGVHKGLFAVRRRIRGEDPVLSLEDVRLRVGVPARDDRIAGTTRLRGQRNRTQQ